MAQCHAAGYTNPASQHGYGRRARQALEDTREGIAAILGADREKAQANIARVSTIVLRQRRLGGDSGWGVW